MALNEEELDISVATGFMEEWLKDSHPVVKDHLRQLIDGVEHWRNKYLASEEKYAILQEQYNQLTALSAQYLGMINEIREQNTSLLIETQRDLHQGGEEE